MRRACPQPTPPGRGRTDPRHSLFGLPDRLPTLSTADANPAPTSQKLHSEATRCAGISRPVRPRTRLTATPRSPWLATPSRAGTFSATASSSSTTPVSSCRTGGSSLRTARSRTCTRTSPPPPDGVRRRRHLLVRRLLVGRQGRAAAHEVAVAVALVDAPHRRPVLVCAQARYRVCRQLPAVGVVPLAGEHRRGVRSVAQRVVVARPLAGRHPLDLRP